MSFSICRCRANMAHIRQSRPDSGVYGLVFTAEQVIKTDRQTEPVGVESIDRDLLLAPRGSLSLSVALSLSLSLSRSRCLSLETSEAAAPVGVEAIDRGLLLAPRGHPRLARLLYRKHGFGGVT